MPGPVLRRPFRVDLDYRLCGGSGARSAGTQAKTWFFEVPAARADDGAWAELLHRIFYDANVALRRREPDDAAWLGLDSFRTAPVDPSAILAWDGKSVEPFPWIQSGQRVVWEAGPCYFVDDAGRYDLLSAHDYTELLMLRLLHAGTIDAAAFIDFFNRYFPKGKPGAGQRMYDERELRFANLVVVRDLPGVFRKPPGGKPWASGPVDPAVLA